MTRVILAALCGIILATGALAQQPTATVTNDGATTTLSVPASSLATEPYPFFVSDQPVAGRSFGIILWLDPTIPDHQGTPRPPGDILAAVSEHMRRDARRRGKVEPSFWDGLRLKLTEKLVREYAAAVQDFGDIRKRDATPAEVISAHQSDMPPPPGQ